LLPENSFTNGATPQHALSEGTYILCLRILQALHQNEQDHQEHGDAQGKMPKSYSYLSALFKTQLDMILDSLH